MPTTGRSNVSPRMLVKALKPKGFSRRKAERAVKAVLDLWKKALARKEPVQVPTGWLVVREIEPKRMLRLGMVVYIPSKKRVFAVRRVPKPKPKDWRFIEPKTRPLSGKDTAR